MSDVLAVHPVVYFMLPAAFLLGSVPFGIIFTKGSGVNIKETGSRNIGATNVLRSAGKARALLTLAADVLKGAVSVLLCLYILKNTGAAPGLNDSFRQTIELWTALAGLAAVIGHMFSVFLSFRGGKGVATGFGVISVYSPESAVILLLIWICVAAVTKYSSLAALAAVVSLPVLFLLQGESLTKIGFGFILGGLIVIKHRTNIRNLISGKESRIR